MLPTATLRIELQPTNPPRPIGVGVFVDGGHIAVIELQELRRAFKALEAIEADLSQPPAAE